MLLFLLILDIVLTLFYAISLPIEIDVRARANIRRGEAQIRIRLWRIFRIHIPIQITLLDAPSGTLTLRLPGGKEKSVPLLARKPKPKPQKKVPWMDLLSYDIDLLRICYTLGVADDAVATVFALGFLRICTDIAARFFGLPAETFMQANFQGNAFEIRAEGMFQLRLVHSIFSYIRYTYREKANTKKERRYTHASR